MAGFKEADCLAVDLVEIITRRAAPFAFFGASAKVMIEGFLAAALFFNPLIGACFDGATLIFTGQDSAPL